MNRIGGTLPAGTVRQLRAPVKEFIRPLSITCSSQLTDRRKRASRQGRVLQKGIE